MTGSPRYMAPGTLYWTSNAVSVECSERHVFPVPFLPAHSHVQFPSFFISEVANKQHYNESCDTYSFSLVLWQMLALEVPFKDYDMQDFFKKVWQAPHDRPPINEDIFGTRLFELLRDCWNPDLRQRRSMAEVEETLREENVVCRGGNETGVPDHQRRRSTYVFQPLELVRLSNSSFRSSGNKSFASLGTTLGFHLSFSRQ